MGYQELIDALKKDNEERIASIWQEAKNVSLKILDEKERRILEIRGRYEVLKETLAREQRERIILDAEKEAKRIRLEVEHIFLERLYNLCKEILYLLRDDLYESFFNALAKEIPIHDWDIVEVNKDDEILAKKLFPSSIILTSQDISGGLRVRMEDDSICIDNTFEKRLERAWKKIIPDLIKEVYDASGVRK